MGGGGDDVRQAEGGGMDAPRHQSGDVGHVHHEPGPPAACGAPVQNGANAGKVDDAGVGAGPGQHQVGVILADLPGDVVVVDEAVFVHVVEHGVVDFPAEIGGGAVTQMAAVIQIHGQNGVPRLQYRLVGRQIGLGAAVGLHVYVVVGLKHLLPLGAAVFLDAVHHLAAAVIPPLAAHAVVAVGGVALAVLIGKAGPHGPHHIVAGEIFAGDQLNGVLLPLPLLLDPLENLGFHIFSPQWPKKGLIKQE